MKNGGSVKVVVVAFLMNLGIAITKLIGWFFTGSSSMLAETIHSFADSSNQIFLYLGLKKSIKEADERHPFGYGKEQYVWAMMVALLIFVVGAGFAVYEGIHKLMHPTEIKNAFINMILLSVGIILESYSSWVAWKAVKRAKKDKSIFQYLRETKDQVLVTVLFEDYAALFGLVLALLGNVIAYFTGDPVWDAIATISIGILLGFIAGFLYSEAKSLLVGEGVTKEEEDNIRGILEKHKGVQKVNELLTMHLSATQILVNAHVKFEKELDIHEIEDIIDELEDEIKAANKNVFRIFIEPHQGRNMIDEK